MDVIADLLKDVALPKMLRVRQIFPDNALTDLEADLHAQFRNPAVAKRITPGASIAVGVGSRGLADLPLLVRVVVDELKARGAIPFIVPAMGSHGSATAAGQTALLASLGVTEESAGCPIRSSMQTVDVGTMPNGLPVPMDALAMQADGIVVINRIKPHTSFTGSVESGLAKMIAIGLGKQRGAEACHSKGYGEMAGNVLEMATIKLATANILFAVGTVENSYDRICKIAVIPGADILTREPELLAEARRNMPRIMFNPLDVLVVDVMGKEYSGTGTDPHITGRGGPFVQTSAQVAKLAVLDLSVKSHGNAAGVGFADICTRRLFSKIDLGATYMNHITSTALAGAKIPMIMETDRRAVQAAIKTCNAPDGRALRVVRVPNTLHLETLLISEPLLDEAHANPAISIVSGLEDWCFDEDDRLMAFHS